MNLTLFTSQKCEPCGFAKSFLQKNGFKFKEICVDKNDKADYRIISKFMVTTVPTLIIEEDGKIEKVEGYPSKGFNKLVEGITEKEDV